MYHYERLSAQDESFLFFEGPATNMNIGGPAVFELGPLAAPGGGVDIRRIRRYVEAGLHHVPRYRQKIVRVPGLGHPVWVDDDRFNLDYHVRHTSLPHPGSEEQLKQLTARILSQRLDRSKPLWELWVVEGLEGNRFAIINKVHHCMVDGVSGVNLLTALMKMHPDATIEPPRPWIPRPAPSGWTLLSEELQRRVELPLAAGLRATARLATQPRAAVRAVEENLAAVYGTLRRGLRAPDPTPINRPIGPHRRIDWLKTDLSAIKEIKKALGGKVNDVVLAIVAGAVRRFFEHRRFHPDVVDFRVVVPVNVRRPEDGLRPGNRVSAWLVDLPVREPDPRKRYEAVCRETEHLRTSPDARVIESLARAAELSDIAVAIGARMTAAFPPYNLIVSNVPGPPFPLYFLGARLIEGYPCVPLFSNQGLSIGSFSYDGQLCWGFNADWDVMPDLPRFTTAMEASFLELLALARDRTPAASAGAAGRAGSKRRNPSRQGRPVRRRAADSGKV